MAGTLAYSLVWIRQHGSGLLPVVLGGGLFCGTTMYAFQSLVIEKDPLFNCVLVLYCLFLYNTAACRGENLTRQRPLAYLVLLTLLLCFLRGNGWPIAAVISLVLLLYRVPRRRVAAVLLPLLIAVKLLTGPVYTALGIHSRLTAEAWAIPLQQLGYVAAHDPQAFERENALQIERVIPVPALAQAYVPYTVDPIKRSPEFSISYFGSLSAKRDLLESWARLAGSQWRGYVYAWAAEVAGYINPRYDGGSYSFAGEEYNGSFGIFSKDLVLGLTGWDGLRPELEARARFIPPALAAFALLLCGVILALRRQTQRILGLLPVYIVWLGLLLGAPSYMQIRYMLALAFLLPAALFMALAPAESGKEGVDEANAASV